MEKTRKARRSIAMAAPNGVTKRRTRVSEVMEVVTVRDPESLNRRRSGRLAPKNVRDVEEDSSDDDVQHIYRRKSLPSGRISSRAASIKVADEMIGVPVPRKARSACIKRSYDCQTSSGSGGDGGFEEDRRSYVSQSSSTVSVKRMKNVSGSKSRIVKPPKSHETIEDDFEIEIAEVLSGLKQHPHSSQREDDSEISVKSSEVKGVENLKLEGDDSSAVVDKSTENPEKSLGLVPETHRTNGTETSILVSDIQTEKELNQEIQRLDSRDSMASKRVSEGPRDESKCSSKLEIDRTVTPTLPSSPEKASLLPLVSDSKLTKDYCKGDSSVKSKEVKIEMNHDPERLSRETGRESSQRSAQQSSLLPLPVAVGELPRPKRCATHLFIARNIQLHKHFVKTNHLSQSVKGSSNLKDRDLRPVAGNPSFQGSSPILNLVFQAQDRIAAAPEDKMPAPDFIFPTSHLLQQVMVPSKSPRPTKNPGSASVNFNQPSSSANEASSPYFTILPTNGYSFQLSSTVRGGTPSPFFNGSFYSPQMFQQPPQILQKPIQAQRETKAGSSSSSSHKQLQPQANAQKHRQQSQKSVKPANGDSLDTQKGGGSYGQNKTASVPPLNFSMSFAGGAAPANLNFSSNHYHIVPAPPAVHQTRAGSCLRNAEDPKKTLSGKQPPELINGQTLVFDNPSRTLNFVSSTWPTNHHTQRQQQSGQSKTMIHSQANSALATSSKNSANASLTSCNSLNLRQFQSHQQIRTHGQTQISFAVPSKSQPSQLK